jgi:hypothetical protein|tara:strand:+ start:29988 stop:31298 length:1311 start_codon:yes stop_codon:yes gene_type:complete
MKINNFNKTGIQKINELNSYLKENHGVKVSGFHPKARLEKVREQAQAHVITLRNSKKQFNLDPEYAKYLGVKDVIDVMLEEGVYAEGAAYESMCNEIKQTTQNLMDGGYTMDEASKQCMNQFRQDPRYAYDDEFILPIVLKAAKDYMEACGGKHESIEPEVQAIPETDLSEVLFREMAREVGMEMTDVESLKAIEEKINMFAEISGKSRDAVVGFLNGLEEDAVAGGIQMFGKKVAEQNKFTGARKDAIAQGKDSFEVDGKMYKITGDTSDEEDQAKNESMFDDIITDMLAEEVEVEQAEVIMAARALADDVQDQIARLGKMVNEDLPAIADQMRAEMGAEVAQGFNDTMVQAIDGHLVASKAVKQSMDDAIGGLTGDAPMQPAMMDEPMDAPMDASLDGEVDAMAEPDAMDVNDPAAAGPEEEPLGRAPVDAEGV